MGFKSPSIVNPLLLFELRHSEFWFQYMNVWRKSLSSPPSKYGKHLVLNWTHSENPLKADDTHLKNLLTSFAAAWKKLVLGHGKPLTNGNTTQAKKKLTFAGRTVKLKVIPWSLLASVGKISRQAARLKYQDQLCGCVYALLWCLVIY